MGYSSLGLCISLTPAAAAKLLQLCLTLYDPIDSSPPGSPIPRILQARTLEWVATSFSSAWKWSRSVVSNSWRPHGLQPSRLLRPWDFPGKSTGSKHQRFLAAWLSFQNQGRFLMVFCIRWKTYRKYDLFTNMEAIPYLTDALLCVSMGWWEAGDVCISLMLTLTLRQSSFRESTIAELIIWCCGCHHELWHVIWWKIERWVQ